ANEQLLKKYWEHGPLPLSKMDQTVKQWTKFLQAVYLGTEVMPNKPAESIEWLSTQERQLSKAKQQQIISQRMGRYVAQATTALQAMYYFCTRESTAVEFIIEKKFQLNIPSTIISGLQIPVIGYMDLVQRFPSGRISVIDWKTGRRSNFSIEKIMQHKQMLLYAYAIKTEFNGVIPDIFIVSQEVWRSDLDPQANTLKQLQNILTSDPYLIPIPMSHYREQELELRQLFSEVWYVLETLIEPPQSISARQAVDSWRPKSALGKLVNLEKNLQESRPVPMISPACGYCPARDLCQQHNADDWQSYREKQNRAKPAPEQIRPQVNSAVVKSSIPAIPIGTNYTLFPGAPEQTLTKQWRKQASVKNWQGLGFVKVKTSSNKVIRKLWNLIPRHWSGAVCPCVEAKWLWEGVLHRADAVIVEAEQYKAGQQKLRQRDERGRLLPLKPLRKSEVVCEQIRSCPVANCPHRK
ncbi:MAG TPA: PD-(D/E)XK nuclease family protein, partial [Candidatus Doudnabacteria bacterium]|nr:PD-(D/E)XK nuclease family protein [Candidatus Doudnabacteria bacterium]